jgi:1,4-alpha-glucan branching enzyme
MHKNKTSMLKWKHTFTYRAPLALNVQLAGDFTDWEKHPVNLRRQSEGLWQASVELEPGEHRYRFLVDGQWRDDPECTMFVSNPFGSRDAVRQVSNGDEKKN